MHVEAGGEAAEVVGAEGGGAEAVFADDDAVARLLAVDLSQQAFGGLELEPLQAVIPEAL